MVLNDSADSATAVSKIGILLPGVLTFKNAGLTGSAIARTTALQSVSVESVLLTHVWQPFIGDEIDRLLESGRLLPTVEVSNLFVELARWASTAHSEGSATPHIDTILTKNGAARIFLEPFIDARATERASVQYYGDSDRIASVDLFSNGQAYAKVFANESGCIARIQEFDDSGKFQTDRFLTATGDVFLVYGSFGESGFGYYSVEGDSKEWIGSKEALIGYWLKRKFRSVELGALVSEFAPHAIHLDAIGEASAVLGTKSIYVLHSNHLKPPYRDARQARPGLADALERISEMDALVVLTDQQRFDLFKKYGHFSRMHVVPHAVEAARSARVGDRDPKLAVIISRVDPGKGHIPFVRAVAEHVNDWQGYRVEVWGAGQLCDELVSEIDRLGVGDIVRYCGFTTSPNEVYSRASVALFPNTQEAQPISVLEAKAVGAVPVGFDFKYGARSMISDCKSGIIVDPGDFSDLSWSCLSLLGNPELCASFASNAAAEANSRSSVDLGRDWKRLIESLQ
ncbi:glycosyltransferase involved in cell wall biosynthesis [Brevibacterium epidermidis]|uniref:Glycosyltransferase involved in cell wall biosynthesis n=1 Tax=Brevibacterium epidermidis TaxID=1698 RepID=A0ABV4EJ47_BREEP